MSNCAWYVHSGVDSWYAVFRLTLKVCPSPRTCMDSPSCPLKFKPRSCTDFDLELKTLMPRRQSEEASISSGLLVSAAKSGERGKDWDIQAKTQGQRLHSCKQVSSQHEHRPASVKASHDHRSQCSRPVHVSCMPAEFVSAVMKHTRPANVHDLDATATKASTLDAECPLPMRCAIGAQLDSALRLSSHDDIIQPLPLGEICL